MKQITAFFLILLTACLAQAQTTTFTYQGKLNDNSLPANGNYELQFKIYDRVAVGTGTQIGGLVQTVNANVVNGIFTVQLDFGEAPFPGTERFIEVSVRRNVNESFVTLAPRQPLTSSPYSIRAKSAETATSATNSAQLGGIAAGQYVLTTDSRMTDERNPLAGSPNYIQNGTAAQSSTNFNISGEGKANIFSAGTQFNISANRVLTNAGTANIFVGEGTGITGNNNAFVGTNAGQANTTGFKNSYFGANTGKLAATATFNSFFGNEAGLNNTADNNSFLGASAGRTNTSGADNTFIGFVTGFSNTSGDENTMVGSRAGQNNTTGGGNSFFGFRAGFANTTVCCNSYFGTSAGEKTNGGGGNSMFGFGAGFNNTSGGGNSFFGDNAGNNNTTGIQNTFIGRAAGIGNIAGSNITLLGTGANVGADNLTNATAIGAGAVVSQSNTIALGRTDGADKVQIFGLGAAGSTQLCRNASNEVSTCSSSRRYKKNINDFRTGLEVVNRLRPVTFNWTADNKPDLGLVAEEVAEADENLVIRNEKGEVEGVKYDRVGVVLVNAVKEQQTQIETQKNRIEDQAKKLEEQQKQVEEQKKQLNEQKKQIELLKQLICSQNTGAAVCKEAK